MHLRRQELHRRLRDEVEARVADFKFTDPEADERAFILREQIIDAELATLRTGSVPDLSFSAQLGRLIAQAGLPLDHHFTAHRTAYPLLLDVALQEAARLRLSRGTVREIVTRHQRYAAATTEACVGAYIEARDIASVDSDRQIRALLDEIELAPTPWPARLVNQAAALDLTAETACVAMLVTWESLPPDITPELIRRRICGWLALAPSDALMSGHAAIEGLVVLSQGGRPAAVVDTLRRAIRQLTSDGIEGLHCGISAVGPALTAKQLIADAGIAHAATNPTTPLCWLAEMTTLEYLVATSTPVVCRLVSQRTVALHRHADATDPSCRRVLAAWYTHQADLRAVAADLHCHPNTILNRLRRIAEISGCDPRKPADLVRLVTELAVLDQHQTAPRRGL